VPALSGQLFTPRTSLTDRGFDYALAGFYLLLLATIESLPLRFTAGDLFTEILKGVSQNKTAESFQTRPFDKCLLRALEAFLHADIPPATF
jgi:hypothetical protein